MRFVVKEELVNCYILGACPGFNTATPRSRIKVIDSNDEPDRTSTASDG